MPLLLVKRAYHCACVCVTGQTGNSYATSRQCTHSITHSTCRVGQEGHRHALGLGKGPGWGGKAGFAAGVAAFSPKHLKKKGFELDPEHLRRERGMAVKGSYFTLTLKHHPEETQRQVLCNR